MSATMTTSAESPPRSTPLALNQTAAFHGYSWFNGIALNVGRMKEYLRQHKYTAAPEHREIVPLNSSKPDEIEILEVRLRSIDQRQEAG
jgi:hypothetical protein